MQYSVTRKIKYPESYMAENTHSMSSQIPNEECLWLISESNYLLLGTTRTCTCTCICILVLLGSSSPKEQLLLLSSLHGHFSLAGYFQHAQPQFTRDCIRIDPTCYHPLFCSSSTYSSFFHASSSFLPILLHRHRH